MTFELKRFTDSDKAVYDSYGFENPLRTFAYPRNWAIDADRDAVLVRFGGRGEQDDDSGEPPDFYGLAWKGRTIALSARVNSRFPSENKQIETYRIAFREDVTDLDTDELVPLVHDGLRAYDVGLRDLPADQIEVILGTRSYW